VERAIVDSRSMRCAIVENEKGMRWILWGCVELCSVRGISFSLEDIPLERGHVISATSRSQTVGETGNFTPRVKCLFLYACLSMYHTISSPLHHHHHYPHATPFMSSMNRSIIPLLYNRRYQKIPENIIQVYRVRYHKKVFGEGL